MDYIDRKKTLIKGMSFVFSYFYYKRKCKILNIKKTRIRHLYIFFFIRDNIRIF